MLFLLKCLIVFFAITSIVVLRPPKSDHLAWYCTVVTMAKQVSVTKNIMPFCRRHKWLQPPFPFYLRPLPVAQREERLSERPGCGGGGGVVASKAKKCGLLLMMYEYILYLL
jgi:hypothetical protein